MDVQFRMPNAMVYRSYVFEGMCDISCAFASVKETCGAERELGRCKKERLRVAHTVVVHRLFEPRIAFLEHFRIDIRNIHGRFSVSVLVPCMVQYPQGDIPVPPATSRHLTGPF